MLAILACRLASARLLLLLIRTQHPPPGPPGMAAGGREGDRRGRGGAEGGAGGGGVLVLGGRVPMRMLNTDPPPVPTIAHPAHCSHPLGRANSRDVRPTGLLDGGP